MYPSSSGGNLKSCSSNLIFKNINTSHTEAKLKLEGLDTVESSFWINSCVNNQEVFHLRENSKIVISSSNYYLVCRDRFNLQI